MPLAPGSRPACARKASSFEIRLGDLDAQEIDPARKPSRGGLGRTFLRVLLSRQEQIGKRIGALRRERGIGAGELDLQHARFRDREHGQVTLHRLDDAIGRIARAAASQQRRENRKQSGRIEFRARGQPELFHDLAGHVGRSGQFGLTSARPDRQSADQDPRSPCRAG